MYFVLTAVFKLSQCVLCWQLFASCPSVYCDDSCFRAALVYFVLTAVFKLSQCVSCWQLFASCPSVCPLFSLVGQHLYCCCSPVTDLCGQLLERLGNQLRLWAASVHHEDRPALLTQFALTDPLRTPPSVTRQVQESSSIRYGCALVSIAFYTSKVQDTGSVRYGCTLVSIAFYTLQFRKIAASGTDLH